MLFSYGEEIQEKVVNLVTSLTGTFTEGNYNETIERCMEMLKYLYIGAAYDSHGFIAAGEMQRVWNELSDEEREEMKRSMLLQLIMLQ